MSEAGLYLIATDEMTQLDTGLVLPSVAFVASTDGFGWWQTLDCTVVTGRICVICPISRDN